jgi:hypothetical protein
MITFRVQRHRLTVKHIRNFFSVRRSMIGTPFFVPGLQERNSPAGHAKHPAPRKPIAILGRSADNQVKSETHFPWKRSAVRHLTGNMSGPFRRGCNGFLRGMTVILLPDCPRSPSCNADNSSGDGGRPGDGPPTLQHGKPGRGLLGQADSSLVMTSFTITS